MDVFCLFVFCFWLLLLVILFDWFLIGFLDRREDVLLFCFCCKNLNFKFFFQKIKNSVHEKNFWKTKKTKKKLMMIIYFCAGWSISDWIFMQISRKGNDDDDDDNWCSWQKQSEEILLLLNSGFWNNFSTHTHAHHVNYNHQWRRGRQQNEKWNWKDSYAIDI